MSVSAGCMDAMDATSLKFAKKTLQDYEVISVIGNGSFGTCYKVCDKETGDLYAWKGIDYDELSESKKESLISEINVLRQLQHPNIVQYYHHLVNHEAKSIFIVMECCEGGDLAQLIARAAKKHQRFEEKYIWRVMFQVCRALQVCHNKIKQGTILHRDIKPANIFLDAAGNAKLGDFGLARILRRNESFAETFVGTPCYMSPEIVKGAKYDRKSDVWAVGCLIYEMCSLRPPFTGREFEQLSANISHGEYHDIPDVYSKDLQEIIKYMLEVSCDQRPSIEIIIRHPIVVRNINDLGNEFPELIDAEEDFYVVAATDNTRCRLEYGSPLRDVSSTMFSEQNSFNEEYGQRRLSLSGIFTPDLRAELFYSARRRILPKAILQQSDPEIYDSVQRERDYAPARECVEQQEPPPRPPLPLPKEASKLATPTIETSPSLLTQKVFDDALQQRLHAIRAQEMLLRQREECLNEREQRLSEKDKRLQELERNLHEKSQALETKERELIKARERSIGVGTQQQLGRPSDPPPIPPRKPKPHDDTYCSIELNETALEQPTVAKLDMASLPAAKAFPTLRKVTFQSPKKLIKYDIENVPAKAAPNVGTVGNTGASHPVQMRASVSSKSSDDSGGSSQSTQHRRKSILSIFGINRSSKESSKASGPVRSKIVPPPTVKLPPACPTNDDVVLAKCETSELNQIWTKEHKRAAFDLLAAMNAAKNDRESVLHSSCAPRHKFRHSVRERNTLHRNRMRRSMIAIAPPPASSMVAAASRERILV